ncbi:hypothetical protein BGZ89_010479 [Linnemannia elongata]|nr:hypothetical protein BGZ89_010479 [Linnemannia elongata]
MGVTCLSVSRIDHPLNDDLSSINTLEVAVNYRQKTPVPKDVVQSIVTSTTKAICAWKEAREASDWSKCAPLLQEQLVLTRQKVAYIIIGGIREEARKINEKVKA